MNDSIFHHRPGKPLLSMTRIEQKWGLGKTLKSNLSRMTPLFFKTVEAGWNILAGADRDKIIESANADRRPSTQYPAFGDGKAGGKIVDILGQLGFTVRINNAALTSKIEELTPIENR